MTFSVPCHQSRYTCLATFFLYIDKLYSLIYFAYIRDPGIVFVHWYCWICS